MHSEIKPKPAIFDYNRLPSPREIAPLGLQHVVAAIVGVVTPALLVSNACGLSAADKTILVQASLLISALTTFVQLFTLGPIGARLPVIMGVSFAYIPTLLAIGGEFGIGAIFGAEIVGGIAAIIVGLSVKRLKALLPPLVTGTVIFSIGLSLYPTAIKYMAGGAGSASYGAPINWLVAVLTLVMVIYLTYFTKGFSKLASILLGMIFGYAISLPLGMVNFDAIGEAGFFMMPPLLRFDIEFVPTAIVSMIIMYVVNSVQAIGDLSATTMGGFDRMPTDKELSGGIMGNGLGAIVGALFGGMPTATYSQNVGILTVNRVINKFVFAFAGLVLLAAGFIPKFAAALTTIPQAVIGGATISVFASITITGIRMIASETFTARNMAVVGIAVALGSGVVQAEGCLGLFPSWVQPVFGSSSVVITTLSAIALNLILPKGA